MLILGIESATEQVGVAIGGHEGIIATFEVARGRRHALGGRATRPCRAVVDRILIAVDGRGVIPSPFAEPNSSLLK